MAAFTIDRNRLVRFLSSDVSLRSGKGHGANGDIDVCAVQAADWLAGGDGTSDAPECVCPVIRAYVVRLNDSSLFEDHRDQLKNFVPKMISTRGNLALMVKRAEIAAKYAAKYAGEYAGESVEYAARSAKYAGEYAAEYAAEAADYAAESAECAARSAAEAAEFAARSAAEAAAKIRETTLKCLDEMIHANDPRPSKGKSKMAAATAKPAIHREILAIPHQYSCGGFWLAERMPDRVKEIAYKGQVIPNNGKFYTLLSGRMEVLSQYQVEKKIECCRQRGEVVDFQYAEELPDGSLLQL